MTDGSLPLEAEDFLIWLASERGRSPNTLAAYRRDLRQYQAHLDDVGTDLHRVDAGSITGYLR
ncbi:MAG: site-specific integrase, partial [Actinomycetota bacterium]